MPQTRLTEAQRRQLHAAQRKVDKAAEGYDAARRDWAKLVRVLGISAVAREMHLTPQGVWQRLKTIEDKRRRSG